MTADVSAGAPVLIGAALRAARVREGLSQADVARALCIDESTPSRWELPEDNSRHRATPLRFLPQLAELLDVTVEELTAGVPTPAPAPVPDPVIQKPRRRDLAVCGRCVERCSCYRDAPLAGPEFLSPVRRAPAGPPFQTYWRHEITLTCLLCGADRTISGNQPSAAPVVLPTVICGRRSPSAVCAGQAVVSEYSIRPCRRWPTNTTDPAPRGSPPFGRHHAQREGRGMTADVQGDRAELVRYLTAPFDPRASVQTLADAAAAKTNADRENWWARLKVRASLEPVA